MHVGNMDQALKLIVLVLISVTRLLSAQPTTSSLKGHVLNALPHLEGWCSKEKAINFIDLVLEVNPEVCVEVGVFGGSSLFPVASALKFLGSGVVIGIDPWDRIECLKNIDPIRNPQNFEWWAKVNLNYVYYLYTSMLQQHKLEPYCITLRTTSEKAIREIQTIDIVYIDGNHSQPSSLQDVTLYLPKVKAGGYIWLNDTLGKERQSAIEHLLTKCDVIKLIDNGNCILFKKR